MRLGTLRIHLFHSTDIQFCPITAYCPPSISLRTTTCFRNKVPPTLMPILVARKHLLQPYPAHVTWRMPSRLPTGRLRRCSYPLAHVRKTVLDGITPVALRNLAYVAESRQRQQIYPRQRECRCGAHLRRHRRAFYHRRNPQKYRCQEPRRTQRRARTWSWA